MLFELLEYKYIVKTMYLLTLNTFLNLHCNGWHMSSYNPFDNFLCIQKNNILCKNLHNCYSKNRHTHNILVLALLL